MKILIVRSWPEQINIASYNVQEIGLANSLIKAGHKCDIVLYQDAKGSKIERRQDGITIYWIHAFNILKNGLFPGLNRIISNYDLIQVHEYDQLQSWLLYTFSNKRIVLYHGPYFDLYNHRYNLKCKIFDLFFLPWSRKARKELPCITKSPLAEKFLRKKGFNNVISLGVGLNTVNFDTEEKKENAIAKNMPDGKINILYVGKLEKRRNIDFLLKVIKDIVQINKDVHVTIIGSGNANYIRTIEAEMLELDKKGFLSYYEKCSQSELGFIYKKADLMLFPSNYEIFGMTLMEAMYFGVACISSLNGGSSQLIESGIDGIILDTFETEQWVLTVNSLITDKEKLLKIQKRAIEKIQHNYRWDCLVRKFIRIYEDTAGECKQI